LYYFGAYENLQSNTKKGLAKLYSKEVRARLGIDDVGKSIADIDAWNGDVILPVKIFLENRTLNLDNVQYRISGDTWKWFVPRAKAAGLLDENQKVPFWTTRLEQVIGYVLPPITNALDATSDYQGQNAVAKFWSVTLYLLMLKLLERQENSIQFEEAEATYRELQTSVGNLLRAESLEPKRDEIILRQAYPTLK
jgi:hypothetical protein